jgi:von Willebrand factor type A domain
VSTPTGRRSFNNGALLLFLLMVVLSSRQCTKPEPAPPASNAATPVPVRNPIGEALQPDPGAVYRDGIAAAILIDTSGSMRDKVRDTDGSTRAKIDIAQRAALNLVKQFDGYARAHSDQTIFVGVYEFSERGRNTPSCREVIKLGRPDPAAAESAIRQMRAQGDTPIGDAMIAAKHDLDKSGLAKRHILVVTDGENNQGYSPGNVTQVISTQAEKDRASIYFVAFDVAASTFNPVKDAGGIVLAASNETELTGTLDYLLTGKILVEQPVGK